MSRIKTHPCGNCIAFGDEVCMQNYLDCDYAEIEEKGEKMIESEKRNLIKVWNKKYKEQLERMIEDFKNGKKYCDVIDCNKCVFSYDNNPNGTGCANYGNLKSFYFEDSSNEEIIKFLEKTLIDLGKTNEEIEEEKNMKTNKKEFHSSHYESDSIEPIELIMSNKMDFCRASIVKYAFRAGKKEGQEALDIKKIIDYAILLAIQEGINFTKEDAQSIIDYRFNWKEERD